MITRTIIAIITQSILNQLHLSMRYSHQLFSQVMEIIIPLETQLCKEENNSKTMITI